MIGDFSGAGLLRILIYIFISISITIIYITSLFSLFSFIIIIVMYFTKKKYNCFCTNKYFMPMFVYTRHRKPFRFMCYDGAR